MQHIGKTLATTSTASTLFQKLRMPSSSFSVFPVSQGCKCYKVGPVLLMYLHTYLAGVIPAIKAPSISTVESVEPKYTLLSLAALVQHYTFTHSPVCWCRGQPLQFVTHCIWQCRGDQPLQSRLAALVQHRFAHCIWQRRGLPLKSTCRLLRALAFSLSLSLNLAANRAVALAPSIWVPPSHFTVPLVPPVLALCWRNSFSSFAFIAADLSA